MRLTHVRPILREALLALLVLGLLFLNFGHVTPAYASGGSVAASGASFCGDPLHAPGERSGHSVCHACRIGGGADLPVVVANAEPLAFAMTDVAFAEPGQRVADRILLELRNARAPPSV